MPEASASTGRNQAVKHLLMIYGNQIAAPGRHDNALAETTIGLYKTELIKG